MKRFYKDVTVGAEAGGFAVLLDGRKVKTPARTVLVLPDKTLADLVAAEWAAQPEKIRPAAMVVTKCANTAVDRMAEKRTEFENAALVYANDLLCYRAVSPKELVAEQARQWDPLLQWFAETFSAPLKSGQGIAPVRQEEPVLETLRGHVAKLDGFTLAALAGTADLLGSLVLAAAVAEGRLNTQDAFALSRIEENFQMKIWGRDAEAVQIAEAKGAEVAALGGFLRACRLCGAVAA